MVLLELTNPLSNIFAILAVFCKLICIGVSEILNPLSYCFSILAVFYTLVCILISVIVNPLSLCLQIVWIFITCKYSVFTLKAIFEVPRRYFLANLVFYAAQ